MIRRRLGELAAAMRGAFANPHLRRLQLAWGATVLGQWSYNVALGVFAFQADGATGVALVALVRFGLGAALAPLAALIGDRFPRRAVMIGANLVRGAALLVAAAAAAAEAPPTVVYAMAAVITVAATAFHPAAAALVPQLARTPEELTAANAVSSTLANAAGLAGPALAGLLYVATGAGAVFAVTAAAFLVSVSLLMRLPERRDARAGAPTRPEGVFREALAGFVVVGRDERLRVIIGLYAASALTWGVLSVVVVVVALQDLGLGDGGPGYLLGAIGVGGVVGGAAAALLAGSRRLAWALGVGTLVWGLPLVAMGAVLEPGVALVALAVLGVGESLIEVATMTLLQRAVPDEVRARVFGVLESLAVGAVAIGGAVAAPILSGLGSRGALLVTGVLLPGLALLLLPRLSDIDRRAAVPQTELALLRGIPLFAVLSAPVVEGLAGRLAPLALPSGQTVVREGEAGELFYVVEDGSLCVSRDGAAVQSLGPGDFFGEIALLRSVPRTATVTTTEAVSLRTLERDEFVAAVTGHAPSREAADAIVGARLTVRAPDGVA